MDPHPALREYHRPITCSLLQGALGDQPVPLLWDMGPLLSFQELGAWDVGLSQS